jgi:hypothetical protein
LDGFAGCSDAEIDTIAALLCKARETPRDTVLGGEEEDFKLYDDNHQMINDPQLLPAITTLRLDWLPEDLIDSFGKSQKSPEWQCAGTYWVHSALIIQTLHFGLMIVSFGVIARSDPKSAPVPPPNEQKIMKPCIPVH